MGYKGMSGAARQALATLKMYKLLESRQRGEVGISKILQAHKLAPTNEDKKQSLFEFLCAPQVFREIFERYPEKLPSDGALTHYLVVERGFGERAARDLIKVFRESVEYAGFDPSGSVVLDAEPGQLELRGGDANFGEKTRRVVSGHGSIAMPSSQVSGTAQVRSSRSPPAAVIAPPGPDDGAYDDPIPVRLRGGRKAWITLPKPFRDDDKDALKAQIDLLIADEDTEVQK
jgi:hypothetical protein